LCGILSKIFDMKGLLFYPKAMLFVALIVTVVALALFYLRSDYNNVSFDFLNDRVPEIGSYIQCEPGTLGESVLTQRKSETDAIRLLVYFRERPSTDVRDFLAQEGVNIYLDTWTLDFLVADSSVDRLCYLAHLPGIELIEHGEEN
jgi:hypothetical protein